MTCSEKYICPFCGAKGYENVGDIIDQIFSPSTNGFWQLVICDECGGSYEMNFSIDPNSAHIVPGQPGEEED